MSSHSATRILPYTREQLFDLAADVESYPEFLPGWVEARVLEHGGNRQRVEQRLGLKWIPLPFVTTAILDRPHRLSIHSSDGPFRFLQIEWRFATAGPAHCTVSLEFKYELRTGLLERLAAATFDQLSPEIIKRFDQRARTLYGTGTETG